MNRRRVRPPHRSFSNPVRPVWRLGMAASVFLTSIGPLAADDLWSDRRRAARSRFADEIAPAADSLKAVLPSAEEAWSGRIFGPTEAAAGASIPGPGLLPAWVRSTVGMDGDVRDVRFPNSAPRRVVIHIQDLHDVEEAQRRVAGLLEQLAASRPGPLPVVLEGAAGAFELPAFRAFADDRARARAADLLLRHNVLSGPEAFGLTTARDARLRGAEDPDLYRENVAVLRDALPRREADAARLAAVVRVFEGLREKKLPPALLALERNSDAYEAGALPLAAYVSALSSPESAGGEGPTVRRLRRVLDIERRVRPERVAEERVRLVERLAPLLSPSETRDLMRAGLDHRLGRGAPDLFHAALTALAASHGVSWSEFPAYAAYETSRAEAEKIDPARLHEELAALAAARRAALATDDGARQLLAAGEDLRLIRRLTAFGLLPGDLPRLQERQKELEQWAERVADWSRTDVPSVAESVRRSALFYSLAERRNGALADRLIETFEDAAPAGAPSVVVLVAGGFHGPGVRDALLGRGVGYIGLVPRALGSSAASLDDFRPGSSPVDRMWSGARRALHRPLVLAADPLDDAPGASERARGLLAGALAAVSLAGAAVDAQAGPLAPGQRVSLARFSPEGRDRLNALAQTAQERAADLTPPLDLTVGVGGLTLVRAPEGGPQLRLPLALAGPAGPDRRTAVVTFSPDGSTVVDLVFERAAAEWRAWAKDEWRKLIGIPVRQGLAVFRSSLVSPWSPGLDEWMGRRLAALGTRSLWSVGQATGGVASFGLLEINRAARWTGWSGLARWTENLRERLLLDEERRWVGLLLRNAPLGVRSALFHRLALAHGMPWDRAWTEALRESLPRLGPGVPPLSVVGVDLRPALPGDPGGATVHVLLNGQPRTLQFSASRSAALADRAMDHALVQVSWGRNAAAPWVTLQAAALADTTVMASVLRHTVREWDALLTDPDLSFSEAHALVREEGEDLRLDLVLERRRWIDPVQTFENGLLNGNLVDVEIDRSRLRGPAWTPADAAAAVRVRPLSTNRTIEQGRQGFFSDFGLSPYLLGTTGPSASEILEDVNRLTARLRSLDVPEPRAWAERLAEVSLKEKIDALRLLARYFRARDRQGEFFPLGSKRAPRVRALSDFVLGLARSVGREAGQLAALRGGAVRPAAPDALLRARAQSAVERFPSLARTLFALLEEAGVTPVPGKEAERTAFAADLLMVYAHAFDEGYGRLAVLTTAFAAREAPDAKGLVVGVFHVRDSLRDSLAAGELVRSLLERGRQGTSAGFAPVVLLDGAGFENATARQLSSELQYRLAEEAPGAPADLRDAALRSLAERLVVVHADAVAQDGRVSLRRLLSWTRSQWAGRTVGTVQIFTRDRDRILDDVRGRLVDWILYLIEPLGLRRLSSSLEDAAAEDRLRRFIASNA
ncbi:MAG: hypothetical protein IPP68_03420 [Elusimicrobia bacterium]|nr:hypothetical protein [Elusimicrobiota bacterium]